MVISWQMVFDEVRMLKKGNNVRTKYNLLRRKTLPNLRQIAQTFCRLGGAGGHGRNKLLDKI